MTPTRHLHARARSLGATISELVRQAAREQYLGKIDERRNAMQAFVGIREGRTDMGGPVEYISGLRRGRSRAARIGTSSSDESS